MNGKLQNSNHRTLQEVEQCVGGNVRFELQMIFQSQTRVVKYINKSQLLSIMSCTFYMLIICYNDEHHYSCCTIAAKANYSSFRRENI